MTSEITHDDRIFDHLLSSEGGMAYAETIVAYKERLGITVLRRPAPAMEADMCIVYKPDYEDGEVVSYHPVEMNNGAPALMGAIAKGFLLTPMEQQDEPLAVPATVEDEVEFATAKPEEQSSPDAAIVEEESVIPLPEEIQEEVQTASETPVADTETSFVCDRKYANGKQCSKVYKTESRFLKHIRDKHAK